MTCSTRGTGARPRNRHASYTFSTRDSDDDDEVDNNEEAESSDEEDIAWAPPPPRYRLYREAESDDSDASN